MGLTAYLQKCGMSVVYEELNESGAVPSAGRKQKKSGRYIWDISYPEYPYALRVMVEAVKLMPAGYQIRILDCGADPDLVQQVDADRLSACVRRQTMGVVKTPRRQSQLGRSVQGLTVIYNQFCARLSYLSEAAVCRRTTDAVFCGSVFGAAGHQTECTGPSGINGLGRREESYEVCFWKE